MVLERRKPLFLALVLFTSLAWHCEAWEHKRAWLGVDICDNSRENSEDAAGIFVLKVQNPSPAFLAGIRSHDVIISLDDMLVASAQYFVCMIAARAPGTVIRIAVIRENQRHDAKATLGAWPDDLQITQGHCQRSVG